MNSWNDCEAIQDKPAQSLRLQLRKATRAVHTALEESWAPRTGFSSREAYRAFLFGNLRAHCEIGLIAARSRNDASETLERARIAALCDDLGIARRGPDVTGNITADYAWGVGYVLNGSALGASWILKTGRLQANWPRSYLTMGRAYAQAGGVREYFDRLDAQDLDAGEVIAGAHAAFAIFAAAERENANDCPPSAFLETV